MSMSQCVQQKEGWGANMATKRKVYIVMGYAYETKSTYISEVCTSLKKAEAHKEFITRIMDGTEHKRNYWIYDARVV